MNMSRRRSVFLATFTSLAVTSVFFFLFRAKEIRSAEAELTRDANIQAAAIEGSLKETLILAKSLRQTILLDELITNEQFSFIARPIMADLQEIQGIQWIPHIERKGLADYESRQRGLLGPDFSVFERSPEKVKVPAAYREDYYPVTFMEPLSSQNRTVLGFDMGSTPERRLAIRKALETNEAAATERISLIQLKGAPNDGGVLLLLPVRKTGGASLKGFCVAVVGLEKFVTKALAQTLPEGLGVELLDLDGAKGKRVLHSIPVDPMAGERWFSFFFPLPEKKLVGFSFAGRQWGVEVAPSWEYYSASILGSSLLTIPVGLVLALIVYLYFSALASEQRRLEELVEERTAEYRATEERLSASEANLIRAQKIARVGSWTWDTATNRVLWSEEMFRIFAIDHAPGTKDVDLEFVMQNRIHPEDMERVKGMNDSVVENAKPGETEYRVVWPDGTVRTVWAMPGGSSKDDQGNIQQLWGIVQDITERKRTETFRGMLKEILRILNHPGSLPQVLQEAVSVLKATTGVDAVGLRLQEDDDFPYFAQTGFPDDFLAKEGSLAHRDREGGVCRDEHGAVSLECTCGMILSRNESRADDLFTSGGSIWTNNSLPFLEVPASDDPRLAPRNECIHYGYASVALIPIRAKGRVVGLLQLNDKRTDRFSEELIESLEAIGTNIGEALVRRQAEEHLKESEAKFAKAFRDAPAMITISSLKDGKYLEVNDKFCEVSGWSREEAVGRTSTELGWISPEERERLRSALLENGSVHEFDLSLRTKDGRPVRCRFNGVIVEVGGEKQLISLAEDVTKRLELESQLAQAQKMEAIGTLAGGIAHDFNNILGAILGYTELTLQSLPPEGEERENLQEVLLASRRAKELVQQILAFGRKGERKVASIDSGVLVSEAMNLLGSVIPKSISIVREIDLAAGHVMADPSDLHQVVMNLCTNAYQAMPEEKGELHVRLAAVSVDEAEAASIHGLTPGEYVRLEVIDDGLGMDEATVARIFEPYFTTKAIGKGTGLGLALVHGIVSGLGGAISLRTTPGVGTAFAVYLPRTEPTAPLAVDTPVASKPLGSAGVLVVDDEPTLARLAAKMLANLGYKTTTLNDPLEAMRVFESDPAAFDAIVTDQTMPGMTGGELIRRAKELKPEVAAVICTGHSDLLEEEGSKLLGVSAFLRKPYDRNTLGSAVAEALGG